MNQKRGHYCKVCGEYKSNESFSGRGHSTHICKECGRLSPSEQAEGITINRLLKIDPGHFIPKETLSWLKNRMKDHRPAVRQLACQIYSVRFPDENDSKETIECDEKVDSVFSLETYSNPIRLRYALENFLADATLRKNSSDRIYKFQRFIYEMYARYMSIAKDGNRDNYFIYPDTTSCIINFLINTSGCVFPGSRNAKATKAFILAYINQTEEQLSPAEFHNLLSDGEICELLKLVNCKCGLIRKVFAGRYLQICRLDVHHFMFNSACALLKEPKPDGTVEDNYMLLLYNADPARCSSPIYVFLHELGHIFHLAVTGKSEILPQKLYEKSLGSLRPYAHDKESAPEIIADIFAGAMMVDTEYENMYPIREFTKEFKLEMADIIKETSESICLQRG